MAYKKCDPNPEKTSQNSGEVIYIAGKISDYQSEFQEHILRFFGKENELKYLGFEVINPARDYTLRKSWQWYLSRDILRIVKVKPIMYFLSNWQESPGAKIEHEVAKQLKLKIIYESNL